MNLILFVIRVWRYRRIYVAYYRRERVATVFFAFVQICSKKGDGNNTRVHVCSLRLLSFSRKSDESSARVSSWNGRDLAGQIYRETTKSKLRERIKDARRLCKQLCARVRMCARVYIHTVYESLSKLSLNNQTVSKQQRSQRPNWVQGFEYRKRE